MSYTFYRKFSDILMINEKQVIDFLKTKDKSYIDYLISLLNNNLNNSNLSNQICPIYESIHVKKNGKDSNEHQRYLYKDCHRTFNDRIYTLFQLVLSYNETMSIFH